MMPELVGSDVLTKCKAFQKYIENGKRERSSLSIHSIKKLTTLGTTRNPYLSFTFLAKYLPLADFFSSKFGLGKPN